MTKVETIKVLIHRDYVRKCKFLEERHKLFMAEVNRIVCGIIYLHNDFAGDNVVLEDIDRTCNSLSGHGVESGYYDVL